MPSHELRETWKKAFWKGHSTYFSVRWDARIINKAIKYMYAAKWSHFTSRGYETVGVRRIEDKAEDRRVQELWHKQTGHTIFHDVLIWDQGDRRVHRFLWVDAWLQHHLCFFTLFISRFGLCVGVYCEQTRLSAFHMWRAWIMKSTKGNFKRCPLSVLWIFFQLASKCLVLYCESGFCLRSWLACRHASKKDCSSV